MRAPLRFAAVIKVAGLTRRFGAHVAVDDISFEVGQGEVVGFLGLNGAGKTTTLRILSGYLPATSGSARVAGFDVLRDSMAVRQRIGYLPESVPLYREQRVAEMLAMQARLHRIPKPERARRIGEVLERVGVLERQHQVIAGLSRGLRQRVGLAMALLHEPEVLILDEPTSGLDPVQRQEVATLLSELASEHTVLLSSHILPEVEAVCPRTIIIHRGEIVADGTKEEMVRGLGRGSSVRLEACVGSDVGEAVRALGLIGGAGKVHDLGSLGIHHVLEIEAAEDLREDVGALAHMKGWAIRELSYQQPTLEQVFARVAVGAAAELQAGDDVAGGVEPSAPGVSVDLESLPMSQGEASGEREIYSLNPFDGGESRDLSKPTQAENGDSPAAEGCDASEGDAPEGDAPEDGDEA